MFLLALLIVVVAAVAVRLAVPALRHLRMLCELRGDWWPRFEQEFRTYASQGWEAAREAERSG